MKKKKPDLTDSLRRALQERVDNGMSVNEMAHAAKVPQPVLSRFMRKARGITLDTAGKLAEMVGLELRSKEI